MKPIVQTDNATSAFAVAHLWSLKLPSGEKEVALRLSLAAQNLGLQCLHVDQFGYIYNSDFELTSHNIFARTDVLFVLHLHFTTMKCHDIWSVFPLWNPPKIIYDWPSPYEYIANLTHHDDYAVSTSNKSVDHLNSLLMPHGRTFDGQVKLLPTLSRSQVLPPRLASFKSPTLFYCGMAWEKSAKQVPRHAHLLRRLDHHSFAAFYGPTHIGTSPAWEGYKQYRGELPFDGGKSLLKQINESGVCLALSSEVHRRAAIMSNRLFEGLAAGALVITDRNDFVVSTLGDCVITVDNDGDQATTYQQVIDAFHLVQRNPSQAQERAAAAQQIFKDKLTLEPMLESLINSLPARKARDRQVLLGRAETVAVDVVVLWTAATLEHFDNVVESLQRQEHRCIRLVVVVDAQHADSVRSLLKTLMGYVSDCIVIELELFNWNVSPVDAAFRRYTTGEMLLAATSSLKGPFVAFIGVLDRWFSDHLVTLVGKLANNADVDVAVATSLRQCMLHGRIDHFYRIPHADLAPSQLLQHLAPHLSLGMTMLRLDYLTEQMTSGLKGLLPSIDHTELTPVILQAQLRNRFMFTHRVTHTRHFFLRDSITDRIDCNFYEHLVYPLETQRIAIRGFAYQRETALNMLELRGVIATNQAIDNLRATVTSEMRQQLLNLINESPVGGSQHKTGESVVLRSGHASSKGRLRSLLRYLEPRALRRYREKRLIRGSGLWDQAWYQSQYPAAVTYEDPLDHFLDRGFSSGCNPSELFSVAWYTTTYTDIDPHRVNPLVHYLRHGRREGRRPRP